MKKGMHVSDMHFFFSQKEMKKPLALNTH